MIKTNRKNTRKTIRIKTYIIEYTILCATINIQILYFHKVI